MSSDDVRVYVPPGWPTQVRPPGAPGWERTALAYLLDLCPANFRLYPVVATSPRVAVFFAQIYVEQRLDACESGLARARSALTESLTPGEMTRVLEAWHAESAQLVRDRRAVLLIQEALAGRPFVAKL